MAMLDLPSQFLLARNPDASIKPLPHTLASQSASFDSLLFAGTSLQPWTTDMLCPPSPLQWGETKGPDGPQVPVVPLENVPLEPIDSDSNVRWQAYYPPQGRKLRRLRSVATGLERAVPGPPLPAGCMWTAMTNADDDDSTSQALNWTQSVHCSQAGLTAVPPLPSGARYL